MNVDGWTCDPSYYGTFDGCNCDCGLVDPDCNPLPNDNPDIIIFGCSAAQSNQLSCVNGTCSYCTTGIGDGVCESQNNNFFCNYDGGDCCQFSCRQSGSGKCQTFDCIDPAYLCLFA